MHFERARDGLAGLNGSTVGVAGPWHEDRLQVTNPSTLNFFSCKLNVFFSNARLLDLSLPLRANLRSLCLILSWG